MRVTQMEHQSIPRERRFGCSRPRSSAHRTSGAWTPDGRSEFLASFGDGVDTVKTRDARTTRDLAFLPEPLRLPEHRLDIFQ